MGVKLRLCKPALPSKSACLRRKRTVIRDYQHRLNVSETERREAQARLTTLLTHRSTGSVPAVQPVARVPWWRRFWGGH
jgi:hypothetical protein